MNDRVAGTYLFSGPEGIGKKLAALNLAKLLNCANPQQSHSSMPDSCDECRSCRKITEGVHPDVMVVKADTAAARPTLKIEQIRQILEVMALQPYEGKHRIIIVDDADTMNESAANAFLKTLEEPAENSHLILVTSRPFSLLPTIRSRCQTIYFQPLQMAEVKEALALNSAPVDHIDTLAAGAEGSPGLALSLVGEEMEKNRRDALLLLSRLPWESFTALSAYAETLSREPADAIQSILRWLLSFLRDKAVFEAVADKSFLTNADLWYDIEKSGDGIRGAAIVRGIALVDETIEALRRNANKQLALETLFMKINEAAA